MNAGIEKALGNPRPRMVLVLRDHIGGLLDAVPAFRAIRRRYANAHITLLCNEVAAPILEGCPYVDRVLPFFAFAEEGHGSRTDRMRAAARQVRMLAGLAMRADIALHFYPPVGGRMLSVLRAIGVRCQAGYEEDSHNHLLDACLGPRGIERRARESNAAVAETVGAACPDLELEVWPRAAAVERVHRLLLASGRRTGEPLVIFHPATHQMCNEWFIERWIQLGRVLHDRHGARVAITGAPGEELVGREIHRSLMDHVINLVGRTTLQEWVAAISLADLVIAPDAAITQVCQALKRPSVSLMGTDDPVHHAPIPGEPMVQVQAWKGPFFPGPRDPHCGERGGVCHHPACRAPSGLAGITVEHVLEGIQKLEERSAIFGRCERRAVIPIGG